jgi:hypothetical protein
MGLIGYPSSAAVHKRPVFRESVPKNERMLARSAR